MPIVSLYEVGRASPLQVKLGVDLTSGFVDLSAVNTVVAGGSYKEYFVIADLQDYATIGEVFRLEIGGVPEDFSWTDDEEEVRQGGEGLPLIGGILVK